MTTANAKQIGGQHYKAQPIQPWDYIAGNNIPYLEGNVIKYVSRWRDKGGIADLEKAKHYLEKLIENNSYDEACAVEGFGVIGQPYDAEMLKAGGTD